MKLSKVIRNVLSLLEVVLFIAAGITVLLLRGAGVQYDRVILGTILIITGSCKFAVFFIEQAYKLPSNFLLISAILMIGFGFIFLFSGTEMETLCFGWGIMEIALGAVEIQTSLFEVKEDKFQIVEIAIALGNIVFGVLLCVRLSNGLNGHLIFMGISFILTGILYLFKHIKRKR